MESTIDLVINVDFTDFVAVILDSDPTFEDLILSNCSPASDTVSLLADFGCSVETGDSFPCVDTLECGC